MTPIKYIAPMVFNNLSKKLNPDDEVFNYSILEEMFADENIKLGVDFERQKPIGKYSADFYYPANNLVLEIDGKDYHSSDKQIEHDDNRDSFMNDMGYIVVRATGSMIKKNQSQIIRIIQHIPKDKIGTFLIKSDSDIANFWRVIGETL